MHWLNLVPNRIYDHALRQAVKGKKFTYDGMVIKAKMVDIYDGDTLTLVFRYRGQLQQHSCRMLGYDSPEMKPPKSNPDREAEMAAAREARQALKDLLEKHTVLKVECGKFDKYGRILVTLYVPDRTGLLGLVGCGGSINVNQWMVDSGYGVPYDGGTKVKRKYEKLK